ncbi:MAG: glutamate 5-kinase [Thermodesulfobacteriota bacterium]
MKDLRKKITKDAKRIIIKLGSSVLVGDVRYGTGRLVEDPENPTLNSLMAEVSLIIEEGKEVIIVSSGSVALGMKNLEIEKRPTSIPEMQAVAAVGQGILMDFYRKHFSALGRKVAQVLLTHDDLSDRKRFLNARNTISALLNLGVIPIINENDTVAVEEIKFGDNDTLAALVTNLVEADLLVMLTNIDGLYDKNPVHDETAKRIPLVKDVDHLKVHKFGDETSHFGTGGITSKIEAARKAAHFGIATIVADGFDRDPITRTLNGEDVGTLFLPREDRLTSKKHWIAFSTRPMGRVFIDDGAKTALSEGKKSLLPSGITTVDGVFESGEVVHLVDSVGMEFARGITNYSSKEIETIRGHKSSEIEGLLGYSVFDEVVHRDNLVIL